MRGQVFVQIDSILTSFFVTQTDYTEKQINLIMEFFTEYLKQYNIWLDKLPDLCSWVPFHTNI